MTQRRIYQNEFPYLITSNTKNRNPIFEDTKLTWKLNRAIQACCVLKGFVLLGFCILPDHFHLLAWKYNPARVGEPTLGDDNNTQPQWLFPSSQRTFSNVRGNHSVSDLMKSIKGSFSRSLDRGSIWQPRFNFRIIDNQKRLHNTLRYIQSNYRKHSLPEKYGQPPHVYSNCKSL